MKKVVLFLFMGMFLSVGAWAVDEISVETATSLSVDKLDISAYEKEIFDTHSDRWAKYELGMELGTDLTEEFSVSAGFEYYETRASMDDSSKTYLSLGYEVLDWLSLGAEYSYNWSQLEEESEEIEYGFELSFDLPFDISISDANNITSGLRDNTHKYVNEFDLSKTLLTWGEEEKDNLSLLLGEEVEYSFDTDLLVSATSTVGLEMAIGSGTVTVEYNFTDNYHDPIDSESLDISLSWDF